MHDRRPALALLVLALSFGAGPALAERSTEPPEGGQTVIYYVGRMYDSGASETIITCTNLGKVDVQVVYEVWTDPNSNPSDGDVYPVPAGGVNAWGLASSPGLAVARLAVSDPRVPVFCVAHFQDATGVRADVPLIRVGKEPKITIK